jgi:hypothetical protein
LSVVSGQFSVLSRRFSATVLGDGAERRLTTDH